MREEENALAYIHTIGVGRYKAKITRESKQSHVEELHAFPAATDFNCIPIADIQKYL